MSDVRRTHPWTLLVLATSLPFVVILCITLWRTPYPLSETVGHFEDLAERPASSYLIPTTSYYRPLFHMTLSALWHSAPSIDSALTRFRLLHIIPIVTLVTLFVWSLRPATPLEAAAATIAVAVLVGSPGFLGNLEVPLSYTIIGMPTALIVWMLLERERRAWHGPAIVALTVLAIGFKEQGLLVVPVVMAACWAGAPGTGRATVAVVTGIAAAYVVFRLAYHPPSLPLFEQDIGLGFAVLSPPDAEARFGAFPIWIYAYNALSTIGNVVFAEPTEGVFRIVRALLGGRLQPWHIVYLLSSLSVTALILWWGIGSLRRAGRQWTPESRLFIVTLVALAASGALSFNYSRDRLGAMAVVFYALATFFAVRAVATRAAQASRTTAAVATVALCLLAGAWQLRTIYTIEFTRQRAANGHREWITDIGRRRADFATRPTFIHIMREMTEQGITPNTIQRTKYPRWLIRLLGEY